MSQTSRYRIAMAAMLIVLVAASLMLTRHFAWERALELADNELEEQLDIVMKGSAESSKQQLLAVKRLQETASSQLCSPLDMARMQGASAVASHLQGVGVVSGNILICSTLTPPEVKVDLGPPDRVYADGFKSWTAVHLPGVDQPLKVDARSGYAMIQVPGQVISAAPDRAGVSLAHIGMLENAWVIVRQRGDYNFSRLLPYSRGVSDRFWQDDQYIVTSYVPSPRAVFMAAMDRSHVNALFWVAVKEIALAAVLLTLCLILCFSYLLRRHFSLKTAIRRALKRGEFRMHYQPVVSIPSGGFVGAEALIRWTRRNGQHMNPGVFIPVAERAGIIGDVTQQVIDMVARDVGRLVQELPHTHIAINLAPSDIDSPHTQVWLTSMVQNAGVGTENVMVEITERGVIEPRNAKEKLGAIRTKGFRLAVDDFGTGQSSLSQIATHNFDYLKIDKSFVDVICTDTMSSKVAFNVISLAKSLGMQMIAEGVETKEQAAVLQRAGVQYAQGWLFAKAMPFEDLLQFARRHSTGEMA